MKLKHVSLGLVLGLVLGPFLGGCSWFGGKDEEVIKPNELTRINEEVKVRVLWSRRVGKGAQDQALKLRPAIYDGKVFAAAADGHVMAMQLGSGKVIWEQQVRNLYTKAELANAFPKGLATITGGVGAGGDVVVVGTASGEIIALNQGDGSFAWRTRTSSEVLAAPQVEDDLVVVQTINGKVAAYDALDGTRKWLYSTSTPSLTLRGTSTPVIVGDVVIAAFANGRVAFLDKERGLAGLDQRIAVSQGSSDLERLVDIDGEMQVVGNMVFIASFQGRMVAIEISSGRMVWAEDSSSVAGVGSGFGNVYLSRADSQLTAFNADNGRQVWNVDALLYRDITNPVTIGSYVAVTDFEGYIHLLAQSDGRFVGRRKIDSSGVNGGLVEDSGRLYALSDGGSLSVLEIQ